VSAPDRDSSLRLRAMLDLPPKTFRMFMVASILGSWVRVSGRPGALRSGERAVAIEVKPKQRDAVLERLGLSSKTWANAVTAWISLRLAHRCGRAIVTLFTTPLHGDAAVCPRCPASLAISPQRGTDVPPTGEESSPHGGNRIAASIGATSANAPVSGRWLQGEEEGVPAASLATPLEELLSQDEEAISRIRRHFGEAKEAAS
jgi:hypothetical protein